MDSGNFEPIIRAAILDMDDFSVIQYLDVIYFKQHGIELEIEFYDANANYTDTVSIERGALINGVEYTIFSGIYYLTSSYQVTRGRFVCSGSLVQPAAINVPADVDYETLIRSVIDIGDMVSTFKNAAADWLDYQFFPDGLRYATGHNFVFFALLKQKYLIHCCDNGINSILFFSAADTLAIGFSVHHHSYSRRYLSAFRRSIASSPGRTRIRSCMLRDRPHYPVHNLGYLETTARSSDLFLRMSWKLVRPVSPSFLISSISPAIVLSSIQSFQDTHRSSLCWM